MKTSELKPHVKELYERAVSNGFSFEGATAKEIANDMIEYDALMDICETPPIAQLIEALKELGIGNAHRHE